MLDAECVLDWELVKRAVQGGFGDQSLARARARVPAPAFPFPLARQRPVVIKLARQMAAAATATVSENLLRVQLARFSRRLRRMRVPVHVLERDLKALESAVRLELWHLVFGLTDNPGKHRGPR